MKFYKLLLLVILSSAAVGATHAQIAISGMVVDSVTLEPLAGTAIKLKTSKKGTTTNDQGFFTIISANYDTLVFSRIGYNTLEYPFLGNEKDILILIREETRTLKEVVVNFYTEEEVVHSAPREVRTLTIGDAFQSPFTYFSKTEKEKRMLVRLQQEQQKVQVYIDVVTRPQFKAEIMDIFSISEEQYYDILIKFNTEKQSAHYLTDKAEIKETVIGYFRSELNK